MHGTKIKIIVVEDQAMLRDSLEQVISQQADMEVIAALADASGTLELCRKLNPDLVLMDVVTENNSNGIAFAAQIRREFPDIKIVIMTSLPEITFVDEAKKAGAHSFIDKNMGNDYLFFAIRSTMKGNGVYPGPQDRANFAGQFTEKEIAVIRLVCQGKTRDEMAKELDLSESSLGRHITAILDKSGFDNIMKFAIYAVGQGFIVTYKP
jgi:DNA-binding NarL/FixJ family response regulator